jgi:hypothetical protein
MGQAAQSVAEQPVDLGGEGWFHVVDARQLGPNRSGDGGLMGSAFGGQRDPRRGAGHHEPAPVVESIDQGVKAAEHERVIYGTNREQVLAVVIVTQSQLPQEHEQVHLRNAELDVLAGRGGGPFEQPIGSAMIVALGGGEHAGLVDPASQVGGDRHIRGGGDDPLGQAGNVAQPGQDPAERLLRRDHAGGDRRPGRRRNG